LHNYTFVEVFCGFVDLFCRPFFAFHDQFYLLSGSAGGGAAVGKLAQIAKSNFSLIVRLKSMLLSIPGSQISLPRKVM